MSESRMEAKESLSCRDMQPVNWGRVRKIMYEREDTEEEAKQASSRMDLGCNQGAKAWRCLNELGYPSNSRGKSYQHTNSQTEMKDKGTQTKVTVLQMVMNDPETMRYIHKISADGVQYALKQTKHLSSTFQAAMSAFDAILEEEEQDEDQTESTH